MQRKRFSATLKSKAVLEVIRGEKTINEIASSYGVHPNQLSLWKKQAIEGLPDVFADGRTKRKKDKSADLDRLYQQIGRLQVELDWLKKKSGLRD